MVLSHNSSVMSKLSLTKAWLWHRFSHPCSRAHAGQ